MSSESHNIELSPEQRAHLLALADDELCVGQNHSWWIAVGPFLEEDLAFVSIAQDELGHARALYELLGAADADHLAYGRSHAEYRSAQICEFRCQEWAEAMVRHLLYDLAEDLRWRALEQSSVVPVAELARRALAEERFHLAHALPLAERLLRADVGRSRLLPVAQRFALAARGLFEPVEGEAALVAAGFLADSSEALEARWRDLVDEVFGADDIDWQLDESPPRRTERSADFAGLHHEMVQVREIDPDAQW